MTEPSIDRSHLPIRDASFTGVAGRTLAESVPDWSIVRKDSDRFAPTAARHDCRPRAPLPVYGDIVYCPKRVRLTVYASGGAYPDRREIGSDRRTGASRRPLA